MLSLELSTIPRVLILTQSRSRIRVQSSAHLKNWILCLHCDFSCLALYRRPSPLPPPAAPPPHHHTHICTHTEPLAAFQTGCVLFLSGSLHL